MSRSRVKDTPKIPIFFFSQTEKLCLFQFSSCKILKIVISSFFLNNLNRRCNLKEGLLSSKKGKVKSSYHLIQTDSLWVERVATSVSPLLQMCSVAAELCEWCGWMLSMGTSDRYRLFLRHHNQCPGTAMAIPVKTHTR